MADRTEMFWPNGVFEDDRFNGTIENVVGTTLVANLPWQRNLG